MENYLTRLAQCDFRTWEGGLFFCKEEKRTTWKMEGETVLSSQTHASSEVLQKVLRQAIIKWMSVSRSHIHCQGSLWQRNYHTQSSPLSTSILHTSLSSSPLCCSSFSCSCFLSPWISLSSLLFCLPPLLSPFLRGRLWSVDRITGKLFGNPNLSEIIWLQPPITCWFGGIRSSLRSNDFHFVFEL